VVNFKETVTSTSSVVCLAKISNKLNRIYATAEPIKETLVTAIENNNFNSSDLKDRARKLTDLYDWDVQTARKIWFFGPEGANDSATNMMVDATHAVPYLPEIRDSLKLGFNMATRQGVLTGEPVRGVRYNVVDCIIHTDPAHRGSGQIGPATKSVLYAAQLTAKPAMVEPIFLCEIQTDREATGPIHSLLSKRRGYVFAEEAKNNSPQVIVKAFLPVVESFGFPQELLGATSGRARPQLLFDHWQVIEGDPFVEGTLANQIVADIRKRKGLPAQLPTLDKFMDKL